MLERWHLVCVGPFLLKNELMRMIVDSRKSVKKQINEIELIQGTDIDGMVETAKENALRKAGVSSDITFKNKCEFKRFSSR